MEIIDRPIYTNQIRPYIGRNIIKVLTGQRRVGKSFILKKIEEEVRATDAEANVITINLEDFAFAHITDAQALHSEIAARVKPEKKNYIFLDEIQEVNDFDKVVRSLIMDENNDVYVTGSNSTMLSSEIATRLAGRSIEIRVHPLSYVEFMEFHKRGDSDETLQLYLQYGGLPYLKNLPDRETWREYLNSVTSAIVYRDVVSRNALRNNDFLQRLLNFLSDNIGRLFTAKKISDYLKSQQMKVNVASVQTYVDYIERAYILNKVSRWDIEGKRYFEIGEKIYFEDMGIRNAIVGYRPQDIGGIIENVVYNHLRIMGYEVKIGSLGQGKEIDFIADKNGERKYIQVATTIMSEETAEREFGNLELVDDNYEKIVVTFNDSFPNTRNGIKAMGLREFLTGN